jgi:hypothetical protein
LSSCATTVVIVMRPARRTLFSLCLALAIPSRDRCYPISGAGLSETSTKDILNGLP